MFAESTKSTQTAFRFSPDILLGMKNRARLRGQSLNAYVEGLIRRDLESKENRYESLYRELETITLPEKISPEILALSKCKVEFTREETATDERLSYLLSK